MAEFVDTYRKEARKAVTGLVEGTAITLHPEYALVYLVHVLAHHPNYPVASGDIPPDPAAYEPFYRYVWLNFSLFLLSSCDFELDLYGSDL
jgi:sister-chromatid-cohesion protein PDS5